MIYAENGAGFEVWASRFDGARLAPISEIASLDYLKVLNDKGRFNLNLPAKVAITALLKKDYLISIYRQPVNAALRLDFRGLLTHWEYSDNANGDTMLKASGYGLNSLLDRRIIYAKPQTAGAAKTAAADDMMKAYVREQLGSSAGARALDATYFSVQADLSQGSSLSLDQSNAKLLAALKTIADNARQAGAEIYFDVQPTGTGTFVFRTFKGQLGQDLTRSGAKVLFSKDRGNLINPKLIIDYDAEVNSVISWGGGHNYKSATDTSRSSLSPFALSENFFNQSNLIVGAQVQAGANAELVKTRPVIKFTAEVMDTPAIQYGKHWEFGDRVSATYANYIFGCLLRSVSVALDGNKRETIKAALEGDLAV